MCYSLNQENFARAISMEAKATFSRRLTITNLLCPLQFKSVFPIRAELSKVRDNGNDFRIRQYLALFSDHCRRPNSGWGNNLCGYSFIWRLTTQAYQLFECFIDPWQRLQIRECAQL